MRGKLLDKNCTSEGEHGNLSIDEMNANCWEPPANPRSKQFSPSEHKSLRAVQAN